MYSLDTLAYLNWSSASNHCLSQHQQQQQQQQNPDDFCPPYSNLCDPIPLCPFLSVLMPEPLD
jgi:hypothetical protein